MITDATHPYETLVPDTVLAAVDAIGLRTDGRLLALNSYENRVYQVGIEDAEPVIVKFYRPGRWSDAAIYEEHKFAAELVALEIPLVPPEQIDGGTLAFLDGFRYSVYVRRGGYWPELATREERMMLGRFLGRLHAVGASARFEHRAEVSPGPMLENPADWILAGDWIPSHLTDAYSTLIDDVIDRVHAVWDAQPVTMIRVHGDLHPGNILWTDTGPHLVDLDDCATGPAMQDLWMLLSGPRDEMAKQLQDLLDGYREFHGFEARELRLLEVLRTMRLVHYSAWIAGRWDDPAFPRAFPWFGTDRYWEEQVLALREQLAAIDEPLLNLD